MNCTISSKAAVQSDTWPSFHCWVSLSFMPSNFPTGLAQCTSANASTAHEITSVVSGERCHLDFHDSCDQLWPMFWSIPFTEMERVSHGPGSGLVRCKCLHSVTSSPFSNHIGADWNKQQCEFFNILELKQKSLCERVSDLGMSYSVNVTADA